MLHTRAKIVCTLGPSSSSYEVVKRLIGAGMNVARLNFSHGDYDDHARSIENVRTAAEELGTVVGVMLDLQGPKVRVGRFREGQATLEPGAAFTITAREVEGTQEIVSTTYAGLPQDVEPGDRILLDDGMMAVRVQAVDGEDVHTTVLVGGVLSNNKGINIPGAALSVETITEKDYRDVDFGIEHDVDFIAMSFVRHPSDLLRMRAHLEASGVRIPIISKIEKPQALDHIGEIIALSDVIMVARGDLGVEMPTEVVPAIQKDLISRCNEQGVPVITATQMLESMVNNPRPTRAEATDVANAILDGSDAVMLSAESASGRYPVEAVEVMKRIIEHTETSSQREDGAARRRRWDAPLAVNEGMAITACTLAEQVHARAIAPITLTGSMARLISKHRPQKDIFAVSQFDHVLRRLTIHWGLQGVLMRDLDSNIDEAVKEVEACLKQLYGLERGDALVFTAGLPFSERQATNMVRVDVIK